MTHYLPPTTTDSRMNALVRWLTDHGFSLAGAQTLTVIGRTSGAPQRIPVNPLVLDGVEYLVAVRGATQWVRNARVAGSGELRRGRRSRRVVLVEVPAADRASIIRRYLDKWGWEVGRFLPEGLGVDATEAQLAEHAEQIPVFAVSAA